ncbi:unnamed protein product, partial [Ectocarpus sp. 8 AP-2014]
ATIADVTDNKRGLLAAPASTSLSPSFSPLSVPGHTAPDSPLRDNLLGDDQPEQEDGLEEGEGVGVLTTETAKGARLSVEDVCVVTPTGGRVLMSGLSFSLDDSERMLIVGESGAGKSSLLRAMAGLWTTGSGKIVRPTKEEMFFLPQRPYCTLGPLRDQITYPSSRGGAEAAGEGGDAGAVEGTAEGGSIADDDELLD